MKKFAAGLLVLTIAAYASLEHIVPIVFSRVLVQRLGTDAAETLPDGLHVGLCGAGSPLPDPERSPPCTLIIAGSKMFLFDVGSSTNIGGMGFNTGNVDGIFLTHFHSDHIGDLGEVMMQRWVAGSHEQPLAVYGPQGVDQVVSGFNQAYALDSAYRTAHHGEDIAPTSGKGGRAIVFQATAETLTPVFTEGNITISAFNVAHSPVEPAVGYLVTYKGRSVAISGDTTAASSIFTHAKGTDLLVHEAMSMELVELAEKSAREAGQKTLEKIFFDIRDYHSAPEDIARNAEEAGIGYIAFTHIVPMLPLPGMEQIFLGESEELFSGEIVVGKDGDFFSLLPGTDEIETTNLL